MCGSNKACIENNARRICLRTHDPKHCRIWARHRPKPPPAQLAAPAPQSSPWWKVAICEESGRDDPTYGYLGILPSTWSSLGLAGTAGDASWSQQVAVAEGIIVRAHVPVPDQNGVCADW